MPFQPGQSGNPSGSPRGPKASKPITDALRVVLNEDATNEQAEALGLAGKAGDFKKCRAIATRLVNDAVAGNTKAAEIILERMEGKVKQQTEVSTEDGSPLFTIQLVSPTNT